MKCTDEISRREDYACRSRSIDDFVCLDEDGRPPKLLFPKERYGYHTWPGQPHNGFAWNYSSSYLKPIWKEQGLDNSFFLAFISRTNSTTNVVHRGTAG